MKRPKKGLYSAVNEGNERIENDEKLFKYIKLFADELLTHRLNRMMLSYTYMLSCCYSLKGISNITKKLVNFLHLSRSAYSLLVTLFK